MTGQEIIEHFQKIYESSCENLRKALRAMRQNGDIGFVPLTEENISLLKEKNEKVREFLQTHQDFKVTRGVKFVFYI